MRRKRNVFAILLAVIVCVVFAKILAHYRKYPEIKEISNYMEGFSYQGRNYSAAAYCVADEDAVCIGRTVDSGDPIYAIGDVNAPDAIFIVGSDNTYQYMADDFKVASSGTITKVLIDPGVRSRNDRVLSAPYDIEMIKRLTAFSGEEVEVTIENYYTQGNTFYFVYHPSLVSNRNNLGGYVAFVDGNWIYVNPEQYQKMENMENNQVKMCGVWIKDSTLIQWMENSDLTKYISQT